MIDEHLTRSIMREVEIHERRIIRAVLAEGASVAPGALVQKGKPVLLVHPDTYAKLQEEWDK